MLNTIMFDVRVYMLSQSHVLQSTPLWPRGACSRNVQGYVHKVCAGYVHRVGHARTRSGRPLARLQNMAVVAVVRVPGGEGGGGW